jgi:hypothetical protein
VSDLWLRRIAWIITIFVFSILSISATMLFLAPDPSNWNRLANLVSSLTAFGAPILGIIIVTRQPHNRIGWLWLIYGMVIGTRTMGHAIYYFGGSQPAGYSTVEYFLLWSTEVGNIAGLICLILLMLWFPNGEMPSRRWRYLNIWLFLAAAVLFLSLFAPGPNWNGGAEAGGIVIDNPFGWLTLNPAFYLGFPAFISIILITILAAISLIFRYRSAGQLVRLQLRWFMLGGIILVILQFVPLFLIGESETVTGMNLFFVVLSQSAIIPLYLAVGIAILRYRLYDIDVIIRKTLQYGVLTLLLVLVYTGSVVLLQSLVENVTGGQSPIVIVISTLMIAAVFNPLRIRIQDFIDRRFYRKKYDAERALAQFAATARDEVDMEILTSALLHVVDNAMQPEHTSLWLRRTHR